MIKSSLRIFKDGTEIPLPPGAYRFIDFAAKPISASANLRRTIDGNLVNLSDSAFQRLEVDISCSDQKIPALSGLWPGAVLTIHSPSIMTEPGPAVTLARDPVPGSIRAYDADGIEIAQPTGRTLNVSGAAYYEYRPILTVMVTAISSSDKEFKASRSWSITAEESDAAEVIVQPTVPDQIVEATGGTVWDWTDADLKNWRTHKITNSDNFVVTAPGEIEVCILSGGGGGPYGGPTYGAGGGGGGGFAKFTASVAVGSYPATIGAGGAQGYEREPWRHGFPGSPSVFLGMSVAGGGGAVGVSGTVSPGRYNGASGGGQRLSDSLAPGTGIFPIGNNGGASGTPSTGSAYRGGGGGGAGGKGGDSTATEAGSGGAGIDISDFIGLQKFVCCGAPGQSNDGTGGVAAVGGAAYTEGGADNTGNGGAQGPGGSGALYIRYRIA
ncbi:glycine-rich domain-containing protein [Thioclava sediminum]|uniref:glycine-rich domain-containing protein n=1 Tax=Thioclava sediminum TaxID=1915319 RepID=UPI0011BAE256|nr:hypothetical protein [Thioclava sediminum]